MPRPAGRSAAKARARPWGTTLAASSIVSPPKKKKKRTSWLRNNGLSLALTGLFLVSFVGQLFAGWSHHNSNALEHGGDVVALAEFARSAMFWESLAENWESEFLQMCAFVLMTAWLFQRGSAESKDPHEAEAGHDEEPPEEESVRPPWPVLKGGIVLRIYRHSLSIALFILFLGSFALHAVSGARNENAERLQHGLPAVSVSEYVTSSRFWFESFQNWQSEFLSIVVLLLLTIVLRESGSPQSKTVLSPHESTGSQ